MNAPIMTPMTPTKRATVFGKLSPIAAFGFDVFDALEEPEVLLAELPVAVASLLATCGDNEQCPSDKDKIGDSGTHTDEEFVAAAFLLPMVEVVTQDDDDGAG